MTSPFSPIQLSRSASCAAGATSPPTTTGARAARGSSSTRRASARRRWRASADFSHLDVIFVFDQVGETQIEHGARHPRGREDWPLVGIFAQRGKNRPNRLGVCTCRIVGVDGLAIEVEGLDAIDGTPVVDIKPAMQGFLPRGDRPRAGLGGGDHEGVLVGPP